jgi:hypothetical protein
MWWQYLWFFLALSYLILFLSVCTSFYNHGLSSNFFDLNVWTVTIIELPARSCRYILLLYTPLMANKYLKASKNEDIKFLR